MKSIRIAVQSFYRMGQQPIHPTLIHRLAEGHVADAGFKVFSIGIHRTHQELVAENKIEVDLVGRNLYLFISAGHAGEYQHTVLCNRLHAFKDHLRSAGGFKDEIEWSELLRALEDWSIESGDVACADFSEQVGAQAGLRLAG